MSLFLFTVIAGWILLSSSAQILIKYGIDTMINTGVTQELFNFDGFKLLLFNKIVLLSGILYLLSLLLYIFAMTRANISFLSPFGGGLIFVITAIMASIFLQEKIPLYGWFGITLTFLGIIITLWAYYQPE